MNIVSRLVVTHSNDITKAFGWFSSHHKFGFIQHANFLTQYWDTEFDYHPLAHHITAVYNLSHFSLRFVDSLGAIFVEPNLKSIINWSTMKS